MVVVTVMVSLGLTVVPVGRMMRGISQFSAQFVAEGMLDMVSPPLRPRV